MELPLAVTRSAAPSPSRSAIANDRGTVTHRKRLRRLKRAVAVAKQYADVKGTSVGGDQIRRSVAVEIGNRHRDRKITHRKRLRRLKRAVAVAQQYADVAGIRHSP